MIKGKNHSILLALLALVCIVFGAWVSRGRASSGTVWEYKTVRVSQSAGEPAQATLNRLGSEGWEAVEMNLHSPDSFDGAYLFKRAK
jgi:hypothetical protein